MIAALAGMSSDPTGASTFGRYCWQAKMAVRTWLGMLTNREALAVVCEHVEDLTVVTAAEFRFAQLKTRDKGSWSAARICEAGHAIASLINAYNQAEAAGVVGLSRFEVWLEGPPSDNRVTTGFFGDPTSAGAELRKKIRELGLARGKVDDFLSRLSIHCQQPSRASVDAVIVRTIGAMWPGMTAGEAERLYESLLQAAEAAQAATQPPPSVRAAMIAAREDPAGAGAWDPIANQSLTTAQLRALCPPLPVDTDTDLFARAAAGEATLLELKLWRAGAGGDTVSSALLARADADVVATVARAAGGMTADAEQALDSRLLDTAGSIARLAASNGTPLQRPGEHIFHAFMSRVADTAALDVDDLYHRDHRLLVGHLCGISDRCRYGWGVS